MIVQLKDTVILTPISHLFLGVVIKDNFSLLAGVNRVMIFSFVNY